MRFWGLCFLLIWQLLPGSTAVAVEPDSSGFAARVLDLTNAERSRVGLQPLTSNPQLQEAAQSYSEVLASSGCFAHACGTVPDLADRDQHWGYSGWTSLGENIATGYTTPESVVAGWMASPTHRANVLSPDYTEIGVGLTSVDRMYWTQEFGARSRD